MASRSVFVVPFDNDPLKYGFKTTVLAATSTVLGHQPLLISTGVTGLITGARRPKPARASIRRATGYESSFVGAAQIVAARQAGYTVGRAKGYGIRSNTALSDTRKITFNGIQYAWQVPKTLLTKAANQLSTLGVDAPAVDAKLIFGANFPKPPKVLIPGVAGGETSSSYFDPAKLDTVPSISGASVINSGKYDADSIPT